MLCALFLLHYNQRFCFLFIFRRLKQWKYIIHLFTQHPVQLLQYSTSVAINRRLLFPFFSYFFRLFLYQDYTDVSKILWHVAIGARHRINLIPPNVHIGWSLFKRKILLKKRKSMKVKCSVKFTSN